MTDQVALSLRLDPEQHERLRRTSFALRRPISDLIREAIDSAHFHAEGVWCEECPTSRRPAPAEPRTVETDEREALAKAWDLGYTAGHSNAMRRMSDEPNAPTSPNPYRVPARADDPTGGA